jgi:replicative DNA helicase|tara:strand:+ start:1028 stop:2419 length:1392 start_codon:yes stop_codon:yes gene_type:complete
MVDDNVFSEAHGFGRTLPHNVAAEMAVLGAIVVDNAVLERLVLEPEHFALEDNERVYRALVEMIGSGRLADLVTLKNSFENDTTFSDIGGADYLKKLVASAVSPATAYEYALTICDLALRRNLIACGEEMIDDAYADGGDARLIVLGAESQLSELNADSPAVSTTPLAVTMPASLEAIEAASRGEGAIGLKTGLADLDALTGGLRAPDLWIVAARPGMGKTALAMATARNVAHGGDDVAFFSLEMSADQLNKRLLSMTTGIEMERLLRGDIGTAEWQGLHTAGKQLAALPLHIDDTAALTASAIRSRALKIQREHGLGLIVVDYLQLMEPPKRYQGQRVNEIAEISGAMKAMAKDLNVPVMLLSQLSRAVEARDDHRPRLADLRDSGSIEQDADIVIFVFRQEYYLQQSEPALGSKKHETWLADISAAAGKATLIIAKHRQGATGKIDLHWNAKRVLFGNLAR